MNRNHTSTLALVLVIQALGFIYFLWFLSKHGYLPTAPFVIERYDSFMDFFYPLYWADNDGRYTLWQSVYPPINFIFLKLIKFLLLGEVSFQDSFSIRETAFPVVLFILSSYLVMPILVLRTQLWGSFSKVEKSLLYFVCILSTPMLFALERGNLIIYAPIFLALALNNANWIRTGSIAILINLKPYFALLLVYYALTGNWKGFMQCTLLTGAVFVATGMLLDPYFLLFFANLFDFSHNDALFPVKNILAMPSSISAFAYALNLSAVQQISKYSHLLNLHAIANIISAFKWIVIAWTFITLYRNHSRFTDTQILAILLVIITNLGIWIGGYSLILYITLLPIFLTMQFSRTYLVILFLLFAPLDFIPLSKDALGEQYSYLTNSMVDVYWTLGLGSVLKPILNFILLIVLTYEAQVLTPSKNN